MKTVLGAAIALASLGCHGSASSDRYALTMTPELQGCIGASPCMRIHFLEPEQGYTRHTLEVILEHDGRLEESRLKLDEGAYTFYSLEQEDLTGYEQKRILHLLASGFHSPETKLSTNPALAFVQEHFEGKVIDLKQLGHPYTLRLIAAQSLSDSSYETRQEDNHGNQFIHNHTIPVFENHRVRRSPEDSVHQHFMDSVSEQCPPALFPHGCYQHAIESESVYSVREKRMVPKEAPPPGVCETEPTAAPETSDCAGTVDREGSMPTENEGGNNHDLLTQLTAYRTTLATVVS